MQTQTPNFPSSLTLDPNMTRLVHLADEHADAAYATGHVLYTREDFVRAADLFRLLVLARPAETRSWLALAACHETANEGELARSFYGHALDAAEGLPDDRLRAAMYLARSAFQDGLQDEAQRALGLAHELAEHAEENAALQVEFLMICRLIDGTHEPRGTRGWS